MAAVLGCALLVGVNAAVPAAVPSSPATEFNISTADLKFILAQIEVSEAHRAAPVAATCVSGSLNLSNCVQPGTNPHSPGSLAPTDVADARLPHGLRQVDGRNNNLLTGFSPWNGAGYGAPTGNSRWGSADQPFARLTSPRWRGGLDTAAWPAGCVAGPSFCIPSPAGTYNPSARPTSVVDPGPRMASNLIADQSACNPAAVAAGGADEPCAGTRDDPSINVPNTATNGVGAPANGLFTLFGQFFDHGLDLVGKTSREAVVVPLASDDPLYVPGSPNNFMIVNRTVLGTGGAGDNSTTPWIDQNQTYTSHPSHQVFLRAFACGTAGAATATCTAGAPPVATGALLDSPTIAHNIANWAEVKQQAAEKLGIALSDFDVTNAPLLATDEYGRFIPGPNGFPMLVNADGTTLTEGDPANPVPTVDLDQSNVAGTGPKDLVRRTGHAFLDDIAHGAAPAFGQAGGVGPWVAQHNATSLARHFITGDGRGNENIGLTAIHTVFHSEHNRVAQQIQALIATPGNEGATATAGTFAFTDWRVGPSAGAAFNGERIFEAARLVTEMQYQHLVFEEFARRVQPAVRPFDAYDPTLDPTITAEFAHAVYRYGHSQLTETIARRADDGSDTSIPLIDGFLNPAAFNEVDGQQINGGEAAGQIVRGMSGQTANEIDEFVTGALRNNLLGLPLDLATLNLARGRDAGVASLNDVRRELFAPAQSPALRPYASWNDFRTALRHPASIVNFIAAYGTHPTIAAATTRPAKRAAAQALLDNNVPDAAQFLTSTGSFAPDANTGKAPTGIEDVDLWNGGLAERRTVFGGLLGSTFDTIFRRQMEHLQESDRLYYLGRLAGTNLLGQIEASSLSDMITRNTDVTSLPRLVFDTPVNTFNQNVSPRTYPQITLDNTGAWHFGGAQHSVFNGLDTAVGLSAGDGQDSGSGDDTLRGNGGNDTLKAGAGADNVTGGAGDDVIDDPSGIDTLIGDQGDDYISSGGPDPDALLGGSGRDVLLSEGPSATLGGEGQDLARGGVADDAISGDEGEDWVEGDTGSDALDGDVAAAPFGVDLVPPAEDVLGGDAGNDLVDGGGAMDILLGGGPGTDSYVGGQGFDWTTYDNPRVPTAAVLSDLDNAIANVNLDDVFVETEALSGGPGNDNLLGSNVALVAPGHEMTVAEFPHITGLPALLAQPGGAARTTPVDAGEIIIGGGGGDTLTGRRGDDIIDGDASLQVRLSAPRARSISGATVPDPDAPGTRVLVASVNQLIPALVTREITAAQVTIRRSIAHAPHGSETDVAVFRNPRANYAVQPIAAPNGVVTFVVTQNPVAGGGGGLSDGSDRVRNVETLRFSDVDVNTAVPAAPTNVTASAPTPGLVTTVQWGEPTTPPDYPVTGYVARAYNALTGQGTGPDTSCTPGVGTPLTCDITLPATGRWFIGVTATSSSGTGVESARVATAVDTAPDPIAAPGVAPAAAPSSGRLTVTWAAPPANGATIFGYTARAWTSNAPAPGTTPAGECSTNSAAGLTCTIDGLADGTQYFVDVVSRYGSGDSPASAKTAGTPTGPPAAPLFVWPSYPAAGSAVTVNWLPPFTGGSAITDYDVEARTAAGAVISCTAPAGATSCALPGPVPNGTPHHLRVRATNAIGTSPWSTPGTAAIAAAVPGAPQNVLLQPLAAPDALRVTWAAAQPNGATVIRYAVTARSASSPQVASCVTTATPPATPARACTLTGVPNGLITIEVAATNAVGLGLPSIPISRTPGPPVAPASGPAVSYPGDGQVGVSWAPFGGNGSPFVTDPYTVRVFDAPTGGTPLPAFFCRGTVGSESCVVSGLTPGTTYWFAVEATNEVNTTPLGRTAGTARSKPGAPTGVTAAPGNARATVSWAAPGATGGVPVSGYSVRVYDAPSGSAPLPRGCTTTGGTSCAVTGLENGREYFVTVVAGNPLTSDESGPRVAVTPNGPAPTPPPAPVAPPPAPPAEAGSAPAAAPPIAAARPATPKCAARDLACRRKAAAATLAAARARAKTRRDAALKSCTTTACRAQARARYQRDLKAAQKAYVKTIRSIR